MATGRPYDPEDLVLGCSWYDPEELDRGYSLGLYGLDDEAKLQEQARSFERGERKCLGRFPEDVVVEAEAKLGRGGEAGPATTAPPTASRRLQRVRGPGHLLSREIIRSRAAPSL